MEWTEGKAQKISTATHSSITTCLVSFLHRQCRTKRRLGTFIGWRLAGSIDGSKNNWYLPRFSTLQRNKVHFHGITISSNWHLQQHRDALWSSTRPIIFQNRQYIRQRRREKTRSRGYVRIANVFYTAMAPFRFLLGRARTRRNDFGSR